MCIRDRLRSRSRCSVRTGPVSYTHLDVYKRQIAESTFDRRHALVYAVALLACGAVAIGSGWWVALGHAGLERRAGSSVPTFIRKDAARDSCRIVTLDLRGDHVSWNLLEGDFGRLGDAERGLAFGGSQAGTATAQSVVHRLAPVSYTHLDVYKRQGAGCPSASGASSSVASSRRGRRRRATARGPVR